MVVNMMPTHITAFDTEHQAALRGLWFCGDVHGYLKHIMRTLAVTPKNELPTHVIFLGDQDLERPFDDYLLPMSREWPSVSYTFILGNHDCDSWGKYGKRTPIHIWRKHRQWFRRRQEQVRG